MVRNARALLTRVDADGDPGTLRITGKMQLTLDRLPPAQDRTTLLGSEGLADRLYDRGLRVKVATPWRFVRRRPPNPVDALLSIASMLLLERCISAVEVRGLDPMAGSSHAPAYGRASLASDFMEEFRTITADAVVLTMLNKRVVTTRDSTALPGGKGGAIGHAA